MYLIQLLAATQNKSWIHIDTIIETLANWQTLAHWKSGAAPGVYVYTARSDTRKLIPSVVL